MLFLYFLLHLRSVQLKFFITMNYTIEKQWEQFLKLNETKELIKYFDAEEIARLKKMYYSGCAFVLRLMVNQVADMPEDLAVVTLDNLYNEANRELNL